MLFLCSNKTSLISSTPFSTTSFKRYVVQEPKGRLSLGIVLLLTGSFQPQLEGDNRPSDSQAHREQVLAAARVKAMNEPANLRKRMDEKVRHAFMSARRNVTTPMCICQLTQYLITIAPQITQFFSDLTSLEYDEAAEMLLTGLAPKVLYNGRALVADIQLMPLYVRFVAVVRRLT
jgi:hypothetical protein